MGEKVIKKAMKMHFSKPGPNLWRMWTVCHVSSTHHIPIGRDLPGEGWHFEYNALSNLSLALMMINEFNK